MLTRYQQTPASKDVMLPDASGEWLKAADVEQHDKEIVQVVKALLKAYNQLLPGIGMMACQDYANINDAPIKAKCLLAKLEEE